MRPSLLPAITMGLICGAALSSASDRDATAGAGFVRLRPEQVHWQDLPEAPGAQIALIAGDPAGHGIYIQRVRFPPHVMDRPHWHPSDRHITVIKGTWYTGTGPDFDPAHAIPLKPGSYMLHPAKALHWDGSNSDEEVIVQVFGIGPADTTPANPKQPFWVQLPR